MTEAHVGRKNVGTRLRGEERRLPAESAAAMAAAHDSELSCAPSCRAVGDGGEYRPEGRAGTVCVGRPARLCIRTATPSRTRAATDPDQRRVAVTPEHVGAAPTGMRLEEPRPPRGMPVIAELGDRPVGGSWRIVAGIVAVGARWRAARMGRAGGAVEGERRSVPGRVVSWVLAGADFRGTKGKGRIHDFVDEYGPIGSGCGGGI